MHDVWQPLTQVRLGALGVAVYPPAATFGPRRLPDYEFVWIIEGEAVAFYDDRRIEAAAGSVLLGRPGMNDRYEWSRTRQTVHAFFHFQLPSLPAGWPLAERWPVIRRLESDDIIRPLFRYLLRLKALHEPMRSCLLRPCVDLMLRSFLSGQVQVPTPPYSQLPRAVEKTLQAIREAAWQSQSGNPTLKDLAARAHVTPEHLCRLFRKTLNLGPLESLRLARLERAATMLGRTDLTIKEITQAVGFSSPYHFSRRFRQTYGLSPRAYRRTVREGGTVRSNPISQALLVDFVSRP